MNEKKKTIWRKNEIKMKKYLKNDVLNLDVLRQEISIENPRRYIEKVVDLETNIRQEEINIQCQFEVTQIFDQGYQH